jgi:hypothetical protein
MMVEIRSKLCLLMISLALVAAPAGASESCGMRVAKMMAAGDAKKVSQMFPKDLVVEAPLASMISHVGTIAQLEELAAPQGGPSSRMSVAHPSMTKTNATVAHAGSWIKAVSSKLGPVQVHVASKSATDCTVLAIHVDVPLQ